MSKQKCEYCSRPIKGEAEEKTIKREKHVFCSEFCFKLYFYKVPTISYEDLMKAYDLRCVSVKCPDFRELEFK